jgi:hypothetical protein
VLAWPTSLWKLADPASTGTRPDHGGDTDASKVFGPFISVWITVRRRATRHHESHEDQDAGRNIGEVVQRVAEQAHRAREEHHSFTWETHHNARRL